MVKVAKNRLSAPLLKSIYVENVQFFRLPGTYLPLIHPSDPSPTAQQIFRQQMYKITPVAPPPGRFHATSLPPPYNASRGHPSANGRLSDIHQPMATCHTSDSRASSAMPGVTSLCSTLLIYSTFGCHFTSMFCSGLTVNIGGTANGTNSCQKT